MDYQGWDEVKTTSGISSHRFILRKTSDNFRQNNTNGGGEWAIHQLPNGDPFLATETTQEL